jgi:hypothetical protein
MVFSEVSGLVVVSFEFDHQQTESLTQQKMRRSHNDCLEFLYINPAESLLRTGGTKAQCLNCLTARVKADVSVLNAARQRV